MVQSVAGKYVFLLVPCYKKECIHPVCKKGKPPSEIVWYENGPPVSVLPLQVPDKSRTWGGECNKCTGFCPGHFLPPRQCFEYISKNGTKDCVAPPSIVLKQAFDDANKTKQDLVDLAPKVAKKTLLSTDEVEIWFQHLQLIKERRVEGSRKAQVTKAKKKGQDFN